MIHDKKYEWPTVDLTKTFDDTISLIAEEYPDTTEAKMIEAKIIAGLTEAAYLGTLASIDFNYINDPLGLNALKQTVVPGIIRWLDEFPEDKPILVNKNTEKGEIDE